MTYPQPIKTLLHKYWRGDCHIGRWYYKQWYLKKIAKPLGWKSYANYMRKKRRKQKTRDRKKFGNKITHLCGYKKKLLKFSNKCGICGKDFIGGETISVDHIKPKSKYPELVYEITNMRLAHLKCNSERPI